MCVRLLGGCVAIVLLLAVALVGPHPRSAQAAPPAAEFDYNLTQSTPRPAPDWVKMIDLGLQNPALKGYSAPEGVRVEIVASNPTVVNPVGMQFSDDGTLHVLEWTVAPSSRQENYEVVRKDGKKLVIQRMAKDTRDLLKTLHDTDGDGKYDQAKVLMDDLELPSSVTFHDGWIYLPSVGHLVRRRASQPGGKFDLQEEILRGFCGYHHHQMSGVSVGPDGFLYVTSGDNDNRGEGVDGSHVDILRTGAIVRCTPDGRRVSEFARGFRNPYRNVVYDENYNMFHVDNDQEDGSKFMGVRLMHVVEGGDYGWRLFPGVICCRTDFQRCSVSGELPGKLPVMLKTGRGAPAGLLHYTGNQFPAFFKGVTVYPDVFRKLVRGYVFEPQGATFRVKQEFTLLQSDDELFRPCQAVTGPDGAIYISDWRADSGGAGRLWGDGKNGRILKLSWGGTPTAPALALARVDSWSRMAQTSDEDLAALLQTGDFERRQRATRELVRRGERGRQVFVSLLQGPDNPAGFAKIHALTGLAQLWNTDVETLTVAQLKHANPNIRRLAADALGNNVVRLADNTPSETFLALLRVLTTDTDLAVKRQAALALAKVGGDGATTGLVTEFARDQSGDAYYRDGLLRAMELTGAAAPMRLVADMTRADATPEQRETAVQAFEAFRTREAAEALGNALKDVAPLTPDQRKRLFLSYRNYQLDPPITAQPVAQWLEKNPTATVEETTVAMNAIALLGGVEPQRLEKMTLGLINAPEREVRLTALANIRSLGAKAAAAPLLASLKVPGRSTDELREIVKTLGVIQAKEALPVLMELARQPGAIRNDALVALAAISQPDAVPVARELLNQDDSELLATSITILGSNPDDARLIGQRYLEKKLPRGTLPQVSDTLGRHAAKSAEISGLLTQVMKGGLLVGLSPEDVKRVEDTVKAQGNPQNGLRVFLDTNKVRCVSCHSLEGLGGQTGPDLSRVWETHSVAKLMESLIEPSTEIKEGYQSWTVETKQGLTFTGLKLLDDGKTVVLRDASAQDHRIAAADIELKQPGVKSLMPDNVVALLTYQEFIDLVAFLKHRQAQESLRTMNLSWWVAGPYSTRLDLSQPPEQCVDHLKPVAGANGKASSWALAHVQPNGLTDFGAVFNNAENISAYALTYVYSPAAQQAELLVGSDEQLRVWVNNQVVYQFNDRRQAFIDQDRVKVNVKAGWNLVLVKSASSTAPHHLYVRMTAARPLRFAREPRLPEGTN